MAETSEQLDKKLREEGYTPNRDGTTYERTNDRGGIERAYTDRDWIQESGSSTWTKRN